MNDDIARRKPTIEAHGELQRACDFDNRWLFGGQLPPCMIRLERKRARTCGYFAAERWRSGRAQSDEIAMNPEHFTTKTRGGKRQPLTRGYHNKEWAGKIIEIGLHPSSKASRAGRRPAAPSPTM